MDGYTSTYHIRNAREFARNPRIQGTPIVAMTASAIQGDREKCQMAGSECTISKPLFSTFNLLTARPVSDYISKPVKKINLERMIVKWAIEGRRMREELVKDSSRLLRPNTSRAPSSFETSVSSIESPQDHLISELDRLEYTQRNALERSSETADVVAMRKQTAEEKAMSLRDDMLIQSADSPRHQLGRVESSVAIDKDGADQMSHSLTSENMQKKYGADQLPGNNDQHRLSMDVDAVSSLAVEPSNPPPPSSVSLTPGPSTTRQIKRSPLGHHGHD
jgi:CheY-like chemotaxis protein